MKKLSIFFYSIVFYVCTITLLGGILAKKISIPYGILLIFLLVGTIFYFIYTVKKAMLDKEKNKILQQENRKLIDIAHDVYETNKEVFDKERSKFILGIGLLLYLIIMLYISMVSDSVFFMFYGSSLVLAGIPLLKFYLKLKSRYKNVLKKYIIDEFFNYTKIKLNSYENSDISRRGTNYNCDIRKEILNYHSKFDKYENYRAMRRRYLSEYFIGYYGDVLVQFMHECSETDFLGWYFLIIDKNISDKYIKIISKKTHNLDKLKQSSHCDFDTYFEMIETDVQNSELIFDLKNFLVNFRDKYKVNFDIVIKDKIYVKFYTEKMFEFKVFGNPIDEKAIYQIHVITKFIEGILEVIN